MNCLWKRLTDVMENEELFRKLEEVMGDHGQLLVSRKVILCQGGVTGLGFQVELSPDLSGAAGGDALKECEALTLEEALKMMAES